MPSLPSPRTAAVLAAAIALPGCGFPRQSNVGYLGGIWVAPASVALDPEPANAGTVGGVAARVDFSDSDVGGWFSARAHLEGAIGGNSSGAAGRLHALAEGGAFSTSHAEHHLFGRLGIAGEVERDPYAGLFLFEAPTLFAGYEHHTGHSDGFLDLLHLDIGPRLGLADVARVFASGQRTDLVFTPEIGGELYLRGNAVNADVSYMRIFTREGLNVVRAAGCAGVGLAFCLDSRFVFGNFPEPRGRVQEVRTMYLGITIGIGAFGDDHRSGGW